MKITDVYKIYSIPLNLQRHMLTVAAVGVVVAEGFDPDLIDRDLIKTTLLLHDMGNILKYNFERVDLLDPADRERIGELRNTQRRFRERYGENADEATLAILRELKVPEMVVNLCRDSHGDELEHFLHTEEWEKKICYYADMRVSPQGVQLLGVRFADLIKRYEAESEKLTHYWAMAEVLEQQIQSHVAIDLSAIPDALISRKQEALEEERILL